MKILQIIKGMGNFFEAYCLSIYDFKNIALVSIYFLSYFVTTSSVMLGQLITMQISTHVLVFMVKIQVEKFENCQDMFAPN